MLDFFSPRVTTLRRRRDVAGLVHVLENGRTRARRAAANALITMPDPRSAEPLVRALRADDPLLRLNAALALGELRGPRREYHEIVEPLTDALRDESAPVRAMAASALGRRKEPRAVAALASLLEDRSELVRMTAAAVLRDFDDPRAVEALTSRGFPA